MDSLRKRLQALLEKDQISNNSNVFVSDSPLLNENLDVFTIETPLKLKDSTPCYYNMASRIQPQENPQRRQENQYPPIPSNQFYSNRGFGKPPIDKRNINYNCAGFFSEPTPIRLVSDSPLVTPLRFCQH